MRKKLLFVNGNLSIGGTEKSLVNLINAIDKEKYDIDLLLFQPGRELLDGLDHRVNVISKDITAAYGPIQKVVLYNIRRKKWFELFLRVSLLLPKSVGLVLLKCLSGQFGLSKRYDAAIAYRPGFSENVVLNCVKARKRITWWHHGNFSNGVNIQTLKRNWTLFDNVVTVSEGIAKHIQDVIPESRGKVAVVYNMINQDELINKAIQKPIELFDNGENILKLVTVSRLSYEKNLGRIIDIAKMLRVRNIPFKWAVVGGGDLYESLTEQISRNKLEKYVFMCGESLNPYVWMYRADLMIHPSLVESFGLVLIEAMAVGTPCIAAKSLGAIDVINTNNGVLVEDRDTDFVNAIIRFWNDLQFKSELAANCGISVRKYSSDQVLNMFYTVIGE